MKPKFKDTLAWEQAQILMQPALIRVIDNIRKQLEISSWQGTYEQIQTPIPGYQLHLTRHDRSADIDIWNLCFQVCFQEYNPAEANINQEQINSTVEVEIDTSLIDRDTGDVDWHRLETKTENLVKKAFADLEVKDGSLEP